MAIFLRAGRLPDVTPSGPYDVTTRAEQIARRRAEMRDALVALSELALIAIVALSPDRDESRRARTALAVKGATVARHPNLIPGFGIG